MDEYTPNLYTLQDEEGNQYTLEMIDTLEIDDDRYFALLPYHENAEEIMDEEEGLIVLKEDFDENNEPCMITIDDDAEYERVGQIFLDRLNEIFFGEDDEEEE